MIDTCKLNGRLIVDMILWIIALCCVSVIVWALFTQEIFVEDKKPEPETKNITLIYITNVEIKGDK